MTVVSTAAFGPDEFAAFFEALHGHEPFKWQRELARRVLASLSVDEAGADGENERGWPRTIEMPTGTGKTAVLDIAVFAMAAEQAARTQVPAAPGRGRRVPRRCFFVVDRRVVVDAAYERARFIARVLKEAEEGVLRTVADRLRELSGAELPLATAILRGGMYREDNWARAPTQALLAVSTVDQVGSRLLNRGYGVGDRMKPIHLGLVANDSLIVLDEAHISAPFEDTLTAIDAFRSWTESEIATPHHVVRMSATLAGNPDFSLADVEERLGLDARLEPRLEAHKRARLHLVEMETPPTRKDDRAAWRKFRQSRPDRDEVFAKACGRAARDLLADGRTRVGVVVSRVGLARRVFELLRRENDANVVLLTGRVRPLDRDRILDDILPLLRPGVAAPSDRPLVVVATQCIEVGADLSFDALVTDCASLDALTQRFGRLDRIGSAGESPAIVLARQDTVDRKAEPDPVYGEALRETWEWLGRSKPKKKDIDFGVRWLPQPDPSQRPKLLAPRRTAPLLLPAYLDAWAQTAPRPALEPEVSLWLHGRPEASVDVQIVWRSDLAPGNRDEWATIASLCPPASMEALPVPLYAARAWLANAAPDEIADVDAAGLGGRSQVPRPSAGGPGPRPFLRWHGEQSAVVDDPGGMRPGDTIVVPASYGGNDGFGWNPGADDAVSDVGDEAQWRQRGRATLRLRGDVGPAWAIGDADPASTSGQSPGRAGGSQATELGAIIHLDELLRRIVAEQGRPDWVSHAARVLLDDSRRSVVPYPDGAGVVVRASRRVRPQADGPVEPSSEFTSEDDASSFTTEVTLSRHSRGVENLARQFAAGCGLGDNLVGDIALAGWLHDVGKADARFQRMLHGGDEVAAAMTVEPWAKSGIQGRAERERARRAAGYPKGERHEIVSLAMIQNCKEVAQRAHDLELVLHLVASHHGYCRPFAPPQSEADLPVTLEHGDMRLAGSVRGGAARLDSGVSERFWGLLRRYGWFGLPYLEAILRLADHRQSESEERGGEQ